MVHQLFRVELTAITAERTVLAICFFGLLILEGNLAILITLVLSRAIMAATRFDRFATF
jgi:hypothetical protein